MSGDAEAILVMSQSTHTRRTNRTGNADCLNCHEDIPVGTRYFRKRTTLIHEGSTYRIYCLDCAVELWYIDESEVNEV